MSQPTPQSRVVLLIDDDSTTNFLHKRAIRRVEEDVTIADALDGEQGYTYLQRTHERGEQAPDYIFLDINMPRLDGWGFLERYRELPAEWREQARLYMLTTSINPDDHERANAYEEVRGVVDKLLTAERFQALVAEEA